MQGGIIRVIYEDNYIFGSICIGKMSDDCGRGSKMIAFRELLALQTKLEKEVENSRLEAEKRICERVREIMAEYGIDVEVRAGGGRRETRRRAVPRYWNPETGQTWSGRGGEPKWIVGKDRSQFLLPAFAKPNEVPTETGDDSTAGSGDDDS
ncbi:H-NS histone family protein [Burkholderia pseudomallei]|uniref:H-NS histone family protein n=1 Tax=Burkholderia pseudomallei TaxID=28450 RepID=UPI00068D1483|nr:H-NS histone family protein [Burkholderia pseudomallei]OMZ78781.1 DNA-binding protein [Burkholderia pseudomallei]ONB59974.1 DNA-binding protein [Burkholderia pseudomallei]ONB85745.1 DNA-binding protein [Burkholderia pseudomallei]ONB96479.1 DNA-binding protein [Burkholderia pseudomallei]ONC63481.1 DNA-binding protein [Burkholderia pseudomallei]